MTRRYAPQVTTHRNYEAQEKAIYQAFLADFGHGQAEAIAKTNTSFQLHYMNEAEARECLVRTGISEEAAAELVSAFAEARSKAEVVVESARAAYKDSPRREPRAAASW